MHKPLSLTKTRTAPTRRAISGTGAALARSAASATAARGVSLLELWRDTTEAFVADAASFLLLGVIGFGLVPLIGPALAVIALPLTRVAIMHIALNKNLRDIGLRQLLVLLITAWIYFAVMALGQTAVTVPLHKWGIHLDFAEQRSATWEGAAQTLSLRSTEMLMLISDSPIKSSILTWRNRVDAELMPKPGNSYEQYLFDEYGSGTFGFDRSKLDGQSSARELNLLQLKLLFIGSVGLIFAAETLFVFRSFLSERPLQIFVLSLKHFGTVAGHLWVLRLVIVGLKALFVFAPLIMVDKFRYLAVSLNWFDSPVQVAILTACLAVINAICMTFEAVYAARLFAALAREQPTA